MTPDESTASAQRVPDVSDSLDPLDPTVEVAAEPPGEARYGYDLGGVNLLFDPTHGAQLLDLPPICPLPNAARWFAGLANVQGSLVPVFDVGATIGEPVTQFDDCRLLVLGQGTRRAGILVNSMPAKVILDVNLGHEPRAVPPPPLGPAVVAEYRYHGKDWLDLDYTGLFSELSRSGAT